MKLFLSSQAISNAQDPAFIKLTAKQAKDTRFALIENAADVAKSHPKWVDDNRAAITSLGFQVEIIDLNKYKQAAQQKSLAEVLGKSDVIWLGGGNTYYLRWLLHETKADNIIKSLVEMGKVYGGGSAGAIVAGPTLNYFELADDPNEAPRLVMDGLGLTDVVVIPHWDDAQYGAILRDAARNLKRAGYQTQPITDSQALVVDGDRQIIIP